MINFKYTVDLIKEPVWICVNKVDSFIESFLKQIHSRVVSWFQTIVKLKTFAPSLKPWKEILVDSFKKWEWLLRLRLYHLSIYWNSSSWLLHSNDRLLDRLLPSLLLRETIQYRNCRKLYLCDYKSVSSCSCIAPFQNRSSYTANQDLFGWSVRLSSVDFESLKLARSSRFQWLL